MTARRGAEAGMGAEESHQALATEVTVLATQATIEALAHRIERAYRRRKSRGYRDRSTSRVWEAAAAVLVKIHGDDPSMPLDPELYVAVQAANTLFPDPWIELTQPRSEWRYRHRVRLMIRGLRAELRAEVRSAEGRIRAGESTVEGLMGGVKRPSPLACYIVARRVGSDELAERLRPAAARQHQSCPLYRPASLPLLPPELYPESELPADQEPVALTRHLRPEILLN
jgi:hypothetical protein